MSQKYEWGGYPPSTYRFSLYCEHPGAILGSAVEEQQAYLVGWSRNKKKPRRNILTSRKNINIAYYYYSYKTLLISSQNMPFQGPPGLHLKGYCGKIQAIPVPKLRTSRDQNEQTGHNQNA